jgi:tRNA-N(6)-(isopentenyl)adenosine-37 thiotransferase enzyme MiaB
LLKTKEISDNSLKILEDRYGAGKNKRKEKKFAVVKTYGCQQNAADGEKLSGILESMGYSITENEEKADIILINTCAVREHAENRIFGNIGALKALKKRNPNMIIAVCGCMTEQKEEIEKIKKSYPFVDLIFGTHSLKRLPELISNVFRNKKRIFIDSDTDEKIYEGLPIKRKGKVKAFVPIMYGCDNYCSYCIVPYVRGRERSRKSEDIISEIKKLLDAGYKEIMLLGQNVNSYGKNLDEDINFAELLRKIDTFPGEYRIRFMSSHPKDATHEMIDVIAESPHICKNLHLPFQCGSNKILQDMNRRYTKEKYLDIVKYAREKIKDLSLSSDVIVGFPGESYEEFKETISFIKQVEFTSLFTFIYSPRKGTRAFSLPDPISKKEKTMWLTELLRAQEEISFKIYESMFGKIYRVLIESKSENGNTLLARTDSNLTMEIEGGEELIGQFKNAEVTYSSGRTLRGKIV